MKKIRAYFLMGFSFLLMVADLLLTWYNTPDLAREANPLVSVWGLGWPALLVVNIASFVLYCVLVYYALVRYPRQKLIAQVGAGKKPSYFLGLVGFTIAFSMPLARLVPVFEWVLITLNKPMDIFYKIVDVIPSMRPDIILSGILALLSAVIWTVRETAADKKQQAEV